MRYTGPKNRIARRENTDLGLKTPGTKSHATLLKRLNVLPGQHGAKGRRKMSEHSRQLREKQKLKIMIGLNEKQLSKYYADAKAKTGNTGMYMAQYIERRLDSVIFRLGLAPTRAAARQLIAHKHVKVNDKLLNVPSHQLRVGDVVSFATEKTAKLPMIETVLARKDMIIPEWLEKKGTSGKMVADPSSDILEAQVNLRLIIEFYSR